MPVRAPVCSCGGRLEKVAIEQPVLGPLFGLNGSFDGPVPGLRCDRCSESTFEGKTVDRMLVAVAMRVLTQPRILTPEEARFLRKAVLGLTQAQLAQRMGIHKITLADWERGERPLSKEHDYEVRGIAIAHLLEARGLVEERPEEMAVSLARVLNSPRLSGPPAKPRPYRIPVAELATRVRAPEPRGSSSAARPATGTSPSRRAL